ncbi:anhydro-N-acetylmuramic acid kinase [Tunturibacter empetritectus]|uniref:Anhydro-N-acetylmuramic acid kinase n=1 Tax=Tunturiibacter empetritectus TaxID=3069691 RepID=A0A7W8IEB0_9BACT|nr:anhydro-N-acetylmuramic acid kinase [Edaphobacter lichenicola]MBB5315590.1 anhydro-N-acetylmuramic acid kinase [Edaphobacter lichenicola]
MKSLVVAGVMSGTSADGVDVAICRVSPALRAGGTPRIKLLGHLGLAYPKTLRAAVLGAMDAEAISVAELARLNWRLGELYAEAVARAQEKFGVTVQLVGCHGQTIYHQGASEKYLGRALRVTWQTGEAAVIAERLRVPVVSDFRPGDLAAGGQGAPLVPMLDYCMFRSAKVSRVLLNLGGIGNLTAIPAKADANGLMAFDTGPGNMVIDTCMKRLYEREFDRGGAVARTGTVLRDVVEKILEETYFSALPPKSCGREQFGETFVSRFVAMCRKAGGREGRDKDVVATATALTAASIAQAYRRFVLGHVGQAAPLSRVEFVVAGGGTKNACLMRMLGAELEPMGVKVRLIEELGVPAQAKEAIAFALLAWLSWSGLPGNVPAATGAPRAVVLGKITHG